MNTMRKLPGLITLCTCLLSLGSVQAATPSSTPSRLDKHLAPIADAAERHVETPLMEQALLRQSIRSNSPLEARWNAAGQVQVYLHYDPQEMTPDIRALTDLGATDIKPSPILHVIQTWLPAGALRAASKLPGITHVSLPRYALFRHVPAIGRVTETGSVTTEGDQILGAAKFRNVTGITGQGITVGVISDGDDHIAESQKTGDLPGNIVNDSHDTNGFTPASSGDEGTAMMEIIYDLAPGVKQLGFCGPQTTVDFMTCLDDFSDDLDANVIVDDLGFPGGPMFSDDVLNTGIRGFTQAHPNIRLVAATGNDGTAYWQGSWTPMSNPVSLNGQSYTQAQNFDTSSSSPTPYLTISSVQPGDKISYIVEWNDPWDDSTTPPPPNDPNDYDVVVFDNPNSDAANTGAGHDAVACNQGITAEPAAPPTSTSLCNQTPASGSPTPGPTPIQGSEWVAKQSTYYLEVFQHGGTPGANLKILVFDISNPVEMFVSPTTPGSVYGHAALAYPAEISVGAINASSALFGSYTIEPFSSQGPVEYGVTGESTVSIPKPDFAAPDCVSVTGAGGFPSPFCGTSAAAPHIAGLVALLMSGYPSQSPYTLLQKASIQPGSGSPNGSFGYGVPILTTLLNAGIFPLPTATISAPSQGASVNTGQQVSFAGTCAAHGVSGGVTQDWNFGSSGIADSTQANPKVTFNKTGKYTVTLTCTDASGTGTADISITVSTPSGGGPLGLLDLAILGLVGALGRRYRKGLSARAH